MKMLEGRRASNFEEATMLAFREAGKDDMSPDIASLFASAMDVDKLDAEGERSIKAAVRERYGGKATWQRKWWFIPVPQLRFEISAVPQLTIRVGAYLVSSVKVETSYSSYSLTLVGTIGKPEVLVMPMTFLWALLDDDLGRFRLVAKDSNHTTWQIPGTKLVEFPNDFLTKLSEIFKRKSVAVWLEDFGSQGRSVAPQVVGSLLGLQSMGAAQPIPAGKQIWTPEQLVSLLEGMAYSVTEAKEMINRAAPHLRADHTLEEAARIVLQQAGKGE